MDPEIYRIAEQILGRRGWNRREAHRDSPESRLPVVRSKQERKF